jgi:hypothetical protein
MDAMRRAARQVLIFGALGVILNYLVAWGLSIRADVRSSGPDGWTRTENVSGGWRASRQTSRGLDKAGLMWHDEMLAPISSYPSSQNPEVSAVLPSWMGLDELPGPPGGVVRGDIDAVIGYAMGWPFRSTRALMIGGFGHGIQRLGAWRSPISAPLQPAISKAGLLIPFRPIWPGLLANTAFYGVILWALWFTPGAVRRAMRKQRGACVRCGYELQGGGQATCPECGAG